MLITQRFVTSSSNLLLLVRTSVHFIDRIRVCSMIRLDQIPANNLSECRTAWYSSSHYLFNCRFVSDNLEHLA